jgi:hypothetical protein
VILYLFVILHYAITLFVITLCQIMPFGAWFLEPFVSMYIK